MTNTDHNRVAAILAHIDERHTSSDFEALCHLCRSEAAQLRALATDLRNEAE